MGIKFRLIVMNFLQYAVWGAWLISLGAYLGNTLKFDGLQIGSFFATMGIASLFMPAVMGIIADRWIPAQRLLGLCHLFAAGFITLAATRTDYNSLYTLVLLSVMFYMPTIALSNSVAYNALEKAGLDIPLLIGGATTSKMHTALKIAPVYHAPVVHLKDASQNASVASKLLNPQLKAELVNELNSEYEVLREKSGLLKRETVSLEEAQKNKLNLF